MELLTDRIESPIGDVLNAAVDRPAAVRALGMIDGRNPISILVPFHGVIGKHGSLTGCGGGLDRKRWLLRHEGALPG